MSPAGNASALIVEHPQAYGRYAPLEHGAYDVPSQESFAFCVAAPSKRKHARSCVRRTRRRAEVAVRDADVRAFPFGARPRYHRNAIDQ